jgi:hypothetical protein
VRTVGTAGVAILPQSACAQKACAAAQAVVPNSPMPLTRRLGDSTGADSILHAKRAALWHDFGRDADAGPQPVAEASRSCVSSHAVANGT